MADIEQRLDELESRVAFQDETIRVLNDTIATQDRQLLAVQAELKVLRERLKELASSAGGGQLASETEETMPPHY